jgi:heme/copper-type cytochrome/quinol oxidase subunit 2
MSNGSIGTGTKVVLTLALVAGAPVAAAAPAAHRSVQRVGFTILPGDRIVEPNIALAPGVPVEMTVTNETREMHTFTVRGLGVRELILPAYGRLPTKTRFTFTPDRRGTFHWHCVICPSGLHGHPHAMKGVLYLIVDPSAFS